MAGLDLRFDNAIVEKKDLRFTSQEQAEAFATTMYERTYNAQSVYRLPDGLFVVYEYQWNVDSKDCAVPRECCSEVAELMGGKEVFYIESTTKE